MDILSEIKQVADSGILPDGDGVLESTRMWLEDLVVMESVVSQGRLKNAERLLRRAVDIMHFHAGRCSIGVYENYSGSEEHLVEYRDVIKEIKEYLEGDKK